MSDIRYSVGHCIGHYEIHEPFYDGILTVISWDIEKDITTIDKVYHHAEFEEPMTLDDIRANFPFVHMVIVEYPLAGAIYRYGNYSDPYWEKIGETMGYA